MPAEQTKRRLWLGARLVVMVLIFAWLFSRVSIVSVAQAFARLSWGAVMTAVALITITLCVGALRWAALLRAYGADVPPSPRETLRLYWVGFFYTMWVPGGVVGDLIRGVASRDAFTQQGATAGLTVVFVERLCGLIGLFAFVGATFTLWPIPGIEHPAVYGLLALAAGLGVLTALHLAPRIAPRLPGRLGDIAGRIPVVRRYGPFLVALALSLVTHLLTALSGHALIAALAPGVPLTASLTIISLAAVSAFFPLTHAGAGVREAAFVWLFGMVHVAEDAAVAGSLALLATQLAVSSVGGVASLLGPTGRIAGSVTDAATSTSASGSASGSAQLVDPLAYDPSPQGEQLPGDVHDA